MRGFYYWGAELKTDGQVTGFSGSRAVVMEGDFSLIGAEFAEVGGEERVGKAWLHN